MNNELVVTALEKKTRAHCCRCRCAGDRMVMAAAAVLTLTLYSRHHPTARSSLLTIIICFHLIFGWRVGAGERGERGGSGISHPPPRVMELAAVGCVCTVCVVRVLKHALALLSLRAGCVCAGVVHYLTGYLSTWTLQMSPLLQTTDVAVRRRRPLRRWRIGSSINTTDFLPRL